MGKSIEELSGWAQANIRHFRQSGFRISLKSSGLVVFIDPWKVPASAGPADLILITHPHTDHRDPAAIAALSRPETVVVLPVSAAQPPQKGMKPGQTERFGAVTVTAVPAYNVSKRFHPRAQEWLGYLVEIDGIRIYHAGDTDLVPEMAGLHPDIALLPVGGLFTMDWRAAAQAARTLNATLAIPMHYNMLIGGRAAGNRFAQDLGSGGLVLPRR